MKNDDDKEISPEAPRKLLLGKRVLRHFNVRTSIQTGSGPQQSYSTRQRCYPPPPDSVSPSLLGP